MHSNLVMGHVYFDHAEPTVFSGNINSFSAPLKPYQSLTADEQQRSKMRVWCLRTEGTMSSQWNAFFFGLL